MDDTQKTSSNQVFNKYKIKVVRNGPYVVTGGAPLIAQTIVTDAEGVSFAWRETRKISVQMVYSLCRCGKSAYLPFCDWTHAEIDFKGDETASFVDYIDQCKTITGLELDLTDARALCAHAGFCDRAGGIWDLVEHSNDPEARKTAIEEAYNCPSGRLVIWDKNGQVMEPVLVPSIAVMESPQGRMVGPIWVRGGIPIESADGKLYEARNRVTLCGCGKSANKPFCDGSHRNKTGT